MILYRIFLFLFVLKAVSALKQQGYGLKITSNTLISPDALEYHFIVSILISPDDKYAVGAEKHWSINLTILISPDD